MSTLVSYAVSKLADNPVGVYMVGFFLEIEDTYESIDRVFGAYGIHPSQVLWDLFTQLAILYVYFAIFRVFFMVFYGLYMIGWECFADFPTVKRLLSLSVDSLMRRYTVSIEHNPQHPNLRQAGGSKMMGMQTVGFNMGMQTVGMGDYRGFPTAASTNSQFEEDMARSSIARTDSGEYETN